MNEPIKVIHKYKNHNKKIQYNVLIFVGNLLNESTNKVLKKIKDKNLYSALTELNDRDIDILTKEYGIKWYKYFFIDKHIQHTFDKIIKTNESKKKEIIKKYGKEWYDTHVESYQEISKIVYSYQTLFKNEKDEKIKNAKNKALIKDMDGISYKIDSMQSNIVGGNSISSGSASLNYTYLENELSDINSTDQFIQNVKNRIMLEENAFNIIKQNKEKYGNIVDSDNYDISDVNNYNNSDIDKGNFLLNSSDIQSNYDSDFDSEIDSNNDSDNDSDDNSETFKMHGGNNEEDDIPDLDISEMTENVTQEVSQQIDVNIVDEFDINELENISKDDVEIDKNADQINASIQEIIDKTEIEEKDNKISQITKWNNEKDNNMYDDELINVYSKTYIYNQYICIDDTIKTIKNKISCGYGKSPAFDLSSPYFIPSRIYLWSEYSYYDVNNVFKTDKIMLGQKWIRKNELLELDIIPNDNIRFYETLKGNLKNLQENIKKYASKITHENDEEIILSDYFDFMTNNEIYMLDIYNDLGIGYQTSHDTVRNVYDVYVKIYYASISFEEFKNIVTYLNLNQNSKTKENLDTEQKTNEGSKISLTYKNIYNDLLMENEILKTIEEIKKNPSLYSGIFKDNYITQSIIHINIKHQNFKNSSKIELYRIFDNFIVNDKYPFIQFQTPDGKLVFKYFSQGTEVDKETIISKWFENAPYGISFKINVDNQKGGKDNKYISISLNENGRMDYKTTWKEDDQATLDDVQKSYDEIRELLKKINKENNKLKVEIPGNHKFKFAFINTIQQFSLPEKYLMSHNDLSDFARYFYPYIAVVIEPRKRQSKILKKNEKSKYGTYLRYKRISKYENEASVEKRIMYFLRNYEFNERLLAGEISKQFNITEKQALDKINFVIEKYPNLKKSRNILKKFDNVPKYKPPGIGIDIQGKSRSNYKMRISGARSKIQLDGIIEFMNILIHLYIETYLYKKKDRQGLKDKLKNLVNIAKRRNKVEDVIETTEIVKTVKQITKLDKERLAYKPEKGQNQWTRNCQNSGDNKKRRPIPYLEKNIDDLIKSGYEYNVDTGEYEKKVMVKKKQVVLKAAKIDNYDQQGNAIYYTCDPKENGEYMYVGFLSRSANPYGLCMPCCFKKDPGISKNKEKRDYHLKCLGKITAETKTKKLVGDKLYILQDSNKIQDNRFGYLPEYLDLYLNTMLEKNKTIKNNYLTSSNTGWFFKYGSKQDDDIFLTAIANALDITVQYIKDKITQILLKQDNAQSIFTSLNNGDIKTQFGNIKSYLRFLHTNFEIDYDLVADVLSIPGIVHEHGLNIIIFDKKTQFIQNEFEKKTLKDDYNIICSNYENLHYFNDPNKINVILLKEEFNYYPIYEVKKEENSKTIDVIKTFVFDASPVSKMPSRVHDSENKKNVISHLFNYIKLNYTQHNFDVKINNAKNTFIKLEEFGLSKYYPTKQIVDKRNKCKYFVIQDKYLLPIKPSGALFWIPIEDNYENYINEINITSDIIYDIYVQSQKNILVKPLGIYYSNKINDKYVVDAIIIDKNINVPIKQNNMSHNDIIAYAKKYKIKEFLTESKSIYDIIDKEITNHNPKKQFIDERIIEVNKSKYNDEGYELFRLELAYYLKDQEKLREKIIKLINKQNIDKYSKKKEIKKILYRLISKQLYDLFSKNENLMLNDFDGNGNITKSKITEDDIKSSDDNSDYLDDADLVPLNITELIDNETNDFNEDNSVKEKQQIKQQTKTKQKQLKTKQIGGKKMFKKPELITSDIKTIASINDKNNEEDDINNLHMFINTNRRLVNINDKEDENKVKSMLINYEVKNNREICPTNLKNACNVNPHCQWKGNSCLFKVTSKQVIEYINKVTEELINNELKSNEILSLENYFVSDIVNKENYTNRENQKIIKSNNNNIKKILSELFGNNNVPIIGKRKLNKISKNINENNILNPIEIVGNKNYQIVHYTSPIYRAFANCYFWNKNSIIDTQHRNLGFYNSLQTDLANYFKSKVIDWVVNKNNQKMIINDLGKITGINNETFINDLKKYFTQSNEVMKSYIYDIYILCKVEKIPIIIYNNYDSVIGIFDDGIKYLSGYLEFQSENKDKYINDKNNIHIKYDVTNFSFTNTPNAIFAIYIN
jgi:hypothetical protein